MSIQTLPPLKCVPDKPDPRDAVIKFDTGVSSNAFLKLFQSPKTPDSVDLRGAMPPILNQRNLASCVSNALSSAYLFYSLQRDKNKGLQISRLHNYYHCRAYRGDAQRDTGVNGIRESLKAAGSSCLPETKWIYDIARFAEKPPNGDPALRIKYFARVEQSAQQVEACLASGNPIMIGLRLFSSFFDSNGPAKTGIVKMPGPKEVFQGGHAVLIVGYDRTKKLFLLRNSWGTSWSPMQGYCWIPYEYILSKSLAYDLWVISLTMTQVTIKI